jgi:hypothetical protein
MTDVSQTTKDIIANLQEPTWRHRRQFPHPWPLLGKVIKFHSTWSREPAYGKCHGQVSEFQYLVSAVHGTVFPNDSEFRVIAFCDIIGIWSEEAFKRTHNG